MYLVFDLEKEGNMGGLIGIVVLLGVMCVFAITILVIFVTISTKIKRTAKDIWGTDDFRQIAQDSEREYANTPKSVNAMTGVLLPRISRDFPHFNYAQMKDKAENVLMAYLGSITSGNINLPSECSDDLKEKLRLRIEQNAMTGCKEVHSNTKIHRTEIARYEKKAGLVSITFQTSMQSMYTKKKNGKLLKGHADLYTQNRFDIEAVYVQDRDKVDRYGTGGTGLNCPSCGAPIKNLGVKHCEYCGNGIVEYNMSVWVFNDITQYK